MAHVSNYQWAGQILGEQRNVDSPERSIAVAQVAAILAVVDEIHQLRQEVQRLANSAEGIQVDLPKQIYDSGESLRQVVRTVAGM